MRKGLLVYNPRSGNRNLARGLDQILSNAQKKGLLLVPFRLGMDQESEDLAVTLLQSPWVEFVIASGGDGTLGSVAKMIIQHRPQLPMGIIPSGTCNDFAESLRLPMEEIDCIDIVAENYVMDLDVGRVNENNFFLSTCAAGMFVNISFNTNTELKKSLGPLAYYFQALGELTHVRTFPMRIETESEVIEGDFFLFLILNGSQGAGFANLYTKARMHDGLMDMLLIRSCPRLELPYLLLELLNRENPVSNKWVRHVQARQFKISSSKSVQTTLDGEKGMALPFNIEVMHQVLRIFVAQHR